MIAVAGRERRDEGRYATESYYIAEVVCQLNATTSGAIEKSNAREEICSAMLTATLSINWQLVNWMANIHRKINLLKLLFSTYHKISVVHDATRCFIHGSRSPNAIIFPSLRATASLRVIIAHLCSPTAKRILP